MVPAGAAFSPSPSLPLVGRVPPRERRWVGGCATGNGPYFFAAFTGSFTFGTVSNSTLYKAPFFFSTLRM